ncbi:MAG: hypothetical protein ACTSQB_01235 [Candidatus Heimdallarchaeota archaeon]
MKIYSLIGKKLIESTPDELLESLVGMLVDEDEEMIRLILTPDTRKKQRELLMQKSADFNKKEYAGTYLVSYLENPAIIKTFLTEIKEGKTTPEPKEAKKTPSKKKKGKKGKKTEPEPVEEDVSILKRWGPEIVKKVVNYLDGKQHASLIDIQDHLETTEGEAYWVTQDLIHIGTLPGRWIGYSDGQWFYQIITEQPLSKEQPKKAKKATTKSTKTTAKKSTTKSTTKPKAKTTTKSKAAKKSTKK